VWWFGVILMKENNFLVTEFEVFSNEFYFRLSFRWKIFISREALVVYFKNILKCGTQKSSSMAATP
jgi:hypothetical protein